MRKLIISISLVTLFSFNGVAQIADENFKPIFKGAVTLPAAVAVQADGKILVGGNITSVGHNSVPGITRLNSDGSQDVSFKINEKVFGRINDILSEENGNIVAVGQQGLSERGDIVRFDAQGNIDPSFTLDTKLFDIDALRIRQQADGKYIVGAFGLNNFIRINTNGSIDPTFNAGTGINSVGISSLDMEIQSDGKLIIVGSFTTFNDLNQNNMVRLNSDGSVDNTFDIGSGPTDDSGFSSINHLEIQSDGKIIISGRFDSFNGTTVNGFVRLNADGSVDNSFVIPTDELANFSDGVSTIKLMANDEIVASGITAVNGRTAFRVLLLKSDGGLNESFQMANYELSRNVGAIYRPGIGITAENNILLVGSIVSVNDSERLGMASIDATGAVLDFNPGLGGPASINKIVKDSNDGFVVGGQFLAVGLKKVGNLVRFNEDYSIDETFLNNVGEATDREVNALEIQKDGKILIGGGFDYFNNERHKGLVRLEADGTLDITFNASIELLFTSTGVVEIHEQEDEKIIIGGSISYVDATKVHNFARLSKTGSLDNTFHTTALLGKYDEIRTIAFQSDGNMILGGENEWEDTGGFLLRTNPEGEVDNTFKHNLDLSNTEITKLGILKDDAILFGSYFSTSFPQNTPIPVRRLDKNGSLLDDTSLAVTDGSIQDFLFLDDDELIFVGGFNKVNSLARSGLVRADLSGGVSTFDTELASNSEWTGEIVNTILLIDEETALIGGVFNLIGNQTGYSGMAKISLIESNPVLSSGFHSIDPAYFFPNPTSNLLNISIHEGFNPISSVELLNIEGKTVLSQTDLTRGHVTLDVSSMLSGIYLLKVNFGKEQMIKRIIIQ